MLSAPISEDPIPSKKVTTLLDLMELTLLSAEYFIGTSQFFKYSSFISIHIVCFSSSKFIECNVNTYFETQVL